MPSKNIKKVFFEGGYYHVYNRGVEKRVIFSDDQDYKVFIHNLRRYLEPGFQVPREDPKTKLRTLITPNHSYNKISLLAFCLMPNHYHLLVKLKEKDGLTDLMKKISTNYTVYFNEKYNRVGKLHQGIYKAVLINSNDQFTQVARYIHLNPNEIVDKGELENYRFSSLYYISHNIKTPWLFWGETLGDTTQQSYYKYLESFVTSDESCNNKLPGLQELLLE